MYEPWVTFARSDERKNVLITQRAMILGAELD